MLLRTVVLLLLCVSSGLCATLGHFQTQAQEEEVPPGDSAALTEGNVTAVDAAEEAPSDNQVSDLPAAQENSIFGDVLSKILAVDSKSEVDVPVANITIAEETHSDRDTALEALTGEAVTQQQPPPEEEEDNDIRPVQTHQFPNKAQEEDNSWSLSSIRNTFQTMHGYFESLVELSGGHNGVCQYRCRYGEAPQPRPGYQLPEPNGCSTSLVGFQVNAAFDLGIPAMTECCNLLDVCYDTCGTSKYDCDTKFRSCLHGICTDLNKSLGYASKVQGCESMADTIYSTVGTLSCRPYMNSQRAACVCKGEEKDEL